MRLKLSSLLAAVSLLCGPAFAAPALPDRADIRDSGFVYCVSGQVNTFNPQKVSSGLIVDTLAAQIYDRLLDVDPYTYRAIPDGQWQSCSALGMSKKDTLAILLPYAFKRALSSYSNEVVLVFKSTSLAYTITLMEVMGHGQLLYGRTYDVMVFGAAGIIYLIVNGLLTLLMRLVERKALAFERRS